MARPRRRAPLAVLAPSERNDFAVEVPTRFGALTHAMITARVEVAFHGCGSPPPRRPPKRDAGQRRRAVADAARLRSMESLLPPVECAACGRLDGRLLFGTLGDSWRSTSGLGEPGRCRSCTDFWKRATVPFSSVSLRELMRSRTTRCIAAACRSSIAATSAGSAKGSELGSGSSRLGPVLRIGSIDPREFRALLRHNGARHAQRLPVAHAAR